jgi:hypothetical protein
MLFTNTIFFGIDPTAGKLPFVFAAIDQDLNVMVIDKGPIDDVLAFAAAQRQAIVGVCAPRRPNQGLMADEAVRQGLRPIPNPGRWMDFRLVEYLLWQRNIRIPRTPGSEEVCPRWMQNGFHIYGRLEELGYRTYPDEQTERQYVEVYPHACYSALLGVLPFAKRTLEGRLQRQLVLYECRLRITDPMRIFEEITRYRLLHGILSAESIFSQGELDALIAAYTVWQLTRGQEHSLLFGDPAEGQIALPVSDLNERYS